MRMNEIYNFFAWLLSQLNQTNFPFLAVVEIASFGVIFLLTLFFCLFSQKVRAHSKRPFLVIVHLFTAMTLAIFASAFTVSQSVGAAALFWCIGYLLYGILCAIRPKKVKNADGAGIPLLAPPVTSRPQAQSAASSAPSAQNVVRLEHALSIADKLLLKNIGRSDRQELERIKTALTVLKVKDSLTAAEGEMLNEMFNALLKLMAKYDL